MRGPAPQGRGGRPPGGCLRHGRGAVFAALCLVAFSAPAAPQDELEFDIPAGPLGTTLLEIARRAERIVSFPPSVVERYTAPAIRGRLTVQQALGVNKATFGDAQWSTGPLPELRTV